MRATPSSRSHFPFSISYICLRCLCFHAILYTQKSPTPKNIHIKTAMCREAEWTHQCPECDRTKAFRRVDYGFCHVAWYECGRRFGACGDVERNAIRYFGDLENLNAHPGLRARMPDEFAFVDSKRSKPKPKPKRR